MVATGFSDVQVAYAAWISPKLLQCLGHTACPLRWREEKETGACQLKPLRTLESKQLKLSVTAANKSLRGFEAKSLSLDFMTWQSGKSTGARMKRTCVIRVCSLILNT